MKLEDRVSAALREATDTRSIVIGQGILNQVREVYRSSFGDLPALVVADDNTYMVAGKVVQEQIGSGEPFVFAGTPTLYGEYGNVEQVRGWLAAQDGVPVAVGSGTVNDLVKLASQELGRPYMVVATAASMDGYTSFGAAISRDGFKLNFPCAAPRTVLADTDVLRQAPLKMTAAGYADLLGKISAGADWIVADALGVEPIDQRCWEMVQTPLREWTADPHLLVEGDSAAFERLIEGLNLSGLAMQAHRTSRTAAGCEHQFSHLWEMDEVEHGVVSHGFKVGLGTVASVALYERVLARGLDAIDLEAVVAVWPTAAEIERSVRANFPNAVLADKSVEHSLAKHLTAEALRDRIELICDVWPTLRERLRRYLPTVAEVAALLDEAGCPTRPSQIGKDLVELKASYIKARQIRARYTILDLAAESGCFASCLDELFAPDGYWTTHA